MAVVVSVLRNDSKDMGVPDRSGDCLTDPARLDCGIRTLCFTLCRVDTPWGIVLIYSGISGNKYLPTRYFRY